MRGKTSIVGWGPWVALIAGCGDMAPARLLPSDGAGASDAAGSVGTGGRHDAGNAKDDAAADATPVDAGPDPYRTLRFEPCEARHRGRTCAPDAAACAVVDDVVLAC